MGKLEYILRNGIIGSVYAFCSGGSLISSKAIYHGVPELVSDIGDSFDETITDISNLVNSDNTIKRKDIKEIHDAVKRLDNYVIINSAQKKIDNIDFRLGETLAFYGSGGKVDVSQIKTSLSSASNQLSTIKLDTQSVYMGGGFFSLALSGIIGLSFGALALKRVVKLFSS